MNELSFRPTLIFPSPLHCPEILKLPSVVPSYDLVEVQDFVVPLYNCTRVVKLKMAITLATDMLETYTLQF